MKNLELWNAVRTPDPKYTKAFNRGGGFKGTATNTQYVCRVATERWGPNGTGWGTEITQEQYVEGAPIMIGEAKVGREIIHVIKGFVWYIDTDNTRRETSQQFGQTTFVGKNKNGVFTDEEAPKKSVTDMMLKCFSLLGFSADIFLGLYDDHKYVNDVRKRLEAGAQDQPSQLPELLPGTNAWTRAIARYKTDGNLEMVLKHMSISDKNKDLIKSEAATED